MVWTGEVPYSIYVITCIVGVMYIQSISWNISICPIYLKGQKVPVLFLGVRHCLAEFCFNSTADQVNLCGNHATSSLLLGIANTGSNNHVIRRKKRVMRLLFKHQTCKIRVYSSSKRFEIYAK